MRAPPALWRAMCLCGLLILDGRCSGADLPVKISWGHQSPAKRPFEFRFVTGQAAVVAVKPVGFEKSDFSSRNLIKSTAGGGDIDALELMLRFKEEVIQPRKDVHSIWRYLLEHTDPDASQRLLNDPAFRPDARRITLEMNQTGTLGFTLTVDQLLQGNCFWVPDLDTFISAGPQPEDFPEHERKHPRSRARVLEDAEEGPEATYAAFTNRWADMGNPKYTNPAAPEPGHIVCIGWDSSQQKFGIDRFAGVRNDLGSGDHFRCEFEFGPPGGGRDSWKSQRLTDGLPVLVTAFETEGVRYELEQFAAPLNPDAEVRGAANLVLFQKIRVRSLDGNAHQGRMVVRCRRELPAAKLTEFEKLPDALVWKTAEPEIALWALEGRDLPTETSTGGETNFVTARVEVAVNVPATGQCEFVMKFPSTPVAHDALLKCMPYAAARDTTLRYWADYLGRGARFDVPERPVNELFRANLWHALRLPRRYSTDPVKIDLPYSNFAYGQRGTPWPINQAVYVDYMLYDLRGYHEIAAEELEVMFRNNQEPNGHVGGFANWGVYTPGMLYAVAQNYLLSGDRTALECLLPQTLKALDWCLTQMRSASQRNESAPGLVLEPLNDLSHEPRAWAFNQAYLFAGTEMLGQALARIGHPRAKECRLAARQMREAIQKGFGRAATRSPLVQLRDGTWSIYVPCDAMTPRRLPEAWYPTDVDCGVAHLPRLQALDPCGLLTAALLNDHEDNLFLNGWGMANEPVYNQQATVYLLRDEPKAAIRAFYSMMACAFSQTVFEPVEHRWGWGQYFGPPSTAGAWFELYRHMLIHEREGGSLLLLQATPRPWLEPGKEIVIERAPTCYGPISIHVRSSPGARTLRAVIKLSGNRAPEEVLIRFRHPEQRLIRTVEVNARTWRDFDRGKEWVRIRNPAEPQYDVIATY